MANRTNDPCPARAEVVWLDDTGDGPAAPPEPKILSLANVAEMFNVTRWRLLSYEFRGLIRRRQRVGRTRVYSWADCERLAFILKCRTAGIALREIGPIVEAADREVPASQLLSAQDDCMALVDRLERRRKATDEALAELAHLHALLTTKSVGNDRPANSN